MKAFPNILLFLWAVTPTAMLAEDSADRADAAEQHAKRSEELADEQDELSADVQQLVIEQTVPQVIELLSEVEGIMDETTDYLAETNTGGVTIAAQTEIIEKIHAAAKAKQKQGGQSQAGGAMMEMMERMMGKKESDGKGEEKGETPSDSGGNGLTGESDATASGIDGIAGNGSELRKVPKMAGRAGNSLPGEFREALDAYNRGLEKIGK